MANIPDELAAKLQRISLLILDVDGVLTDGKLFFGPTGETLKVFNTLDGHGIKQLQRCGVRVGIVTGRSSDMVAKRARDLGITLLIQGREDKAAAFAEFLQEHPVALEQVAWMGDDLPDLEVMRQVGLALTVPNAHWSVKQHAHWQSQASGGQGAVREACDLLLVAQGHWDKLMAETLNKPL